MSDHHRATRSAAELAAWQARKRPGRRGVYPILAPEPDKRISSDGKLYRVTPDGQWRRFRMEVA